MRPTILLVEDEGTDAYFVGWAIQKAGFIWHLQHVEDGQRAIEYLERTNGFENSPAPDLILLDLNMPRMSGFEFLEWLKSRPGGPQVKVVILSSSDHPSDMQRARNLGAEDYRIKPHNPSGLLEFVHEIRSKWLPEKKDGTGEEAK